MSSNGILLGPYLFDGGVCVCVCVYVCVCVFIFFHREGFFRLQNVQDILECTDQRSCVVNKFPSSQVPSSPYLKMSYFTSKDENSSRALTGEKTI